MKTDIVVLAAGAGKRLRSSTPKPLLAVAGKPLLAHVLEAARQLSPQRIIVVAAPESPVAVFAAAEKDIVIATQKTPKGTADALRCAMPLVRRNGIVLVLCADTPLLSATVLRKLQKSAAAAPVFLTFLTNTPGNYGRVVRDANGKVAAITEFRDASAAQRKINEVYAGVLAAPARMIDGMLSRIGDANAAGERYLTDIAALSATAGVAATAVRCDADDCLGVNTAADLQHAERVWQRRQAEKLMRRGVRLADAARLDVRGEVVAARDVEIDVNVVLGGRVVLSSGCKIGANCVIHDSHIGADTVIEPFSHITQARIGARCKIGPYARLRSGADVAAAVKIGNFVEVKNSKIKSGVKAGHLAYIGDSDVGGNVNIGAGVITCNYDGKNKYRTRIESDAFIGSDTQLIAPITIGRGAYVAAGSTITKDIKANTLVIARARQTVRRRD